MTKEQKGQSFKGWAVVAIHALLIVAIAAIFVSGANAAHWSLTADCCSCWSC